MQNAKIIGLLFLATLLCFQPAISSQTQTFTTVLSCFNNALPIPTPAITGQATAPICINGVLQTSGGGGATPIPFPTFPWPISLPTSFQTSFPTPLPNSSSVPFYITCVVVAPGVCPTPLAIQPISLPVSFQTAFPTPIPFPTLGAVVLNTPSVNCVNCPAAGPTSAGGFPYVQITALPNPLPVTTAPPLTYPTTSAGYLLVAPTALPTLSVNCVNCYAPSTPTAPAVITTPAASVTSITVLAANSAANGYSLCNNSTSIAYIAFAATASSSAYTMQFAAAPSPCFIASGSQMYRGIISGIWVSANGTMIVTEW